MRIPIAENDIGTIHKWGRNAVYWFRFTDNGYYDNQRKMTFAEFKAEYPVADSRNIHRRAKTNKDLKY